jgi:hypothetical protein
MRLPKRTLRIDQPFMIGASAACICDICVGVVMLVSNRPKCGCRIPEMMYCQRYADSIALLICVLSFALKVRATLCMK